MHKTLKKLLLPVAAIVASVPLSAVASLTCQATLSGEQEPGNVVTDASATLVATFDAALSQVDVELTVLGAPDADRAHFHCARPGANGAIAFGLVAPGPLFFDFGGVRGTLLNEDFNGAMCGPNTDGREVNNIAALAFAMRDGFVYINVHTPANPAGEIRGQIVCNDAHAHKIPPGLAHKK